MIFLFTFGGKDRFYPLEKQACWLSTGKWRNPYFYDQEFLLHDFDSIILVTDIKTYAGCTYEYDVSLHFTDKTGTGRVKIFAKSDTIKSGKDAFIKFYWPDDSLKFKRIH